MNTLYQAEPSVNTPPNLRVVPRTIRDEEAPPYDGQPSRQREPFLMISHEVFREYAAKAGPIAWSVFTALVFHADAHGECFPSHATLATEIGLRDRKTIIPAIARLAELGMIRAEQRSGNNGAITSKQYKILVGMHVRETDIPMSAKGTPPVRQTDRVCPSNGQELEPVNKNQLTKTVNTPLPPKGERAQKPKAPTYKAEFETFWTAYPSGNGNKKQAGAQWDRLAPDDALLTEIMAGLDRWKACGRWRRGYVKSAEIWLRDRWWENEPPADRAEVAMPSSRGRPDYDGQPNLTNDDLDALIAGVR